MPTVPNKIIKMPFGKYSGAELQDVPLDYLQWFESNVKEMGKWLRDAINHEINRRTGDLSSKGRDVRGI